MKQLDLFDNMPRYDFKGPFKLKYGVYDGKYVVLPQGTENVYIAFNASSKTYIDKKTKKVHKQNVYKVDGQIYNA